MASLSPEDRASIDAFITRTAGAARTRSRDLKLSIDEAQLLVAAIGRLLVNRVEDDRVEVVVRSEF